MLPEAKYIMVCPRLFNVGARFTIATQFTIKIVTKFFIAINTKRRRYKARLYDERLYRSSDDLFDAFLLDMTSADFAHHGNSGSNVENCGRQAGI
ncbi:hypothetical protein JOB18_016147 [Solea senegalensis]|uniref:Uncharacterized protein n=1 Tax=Solea senegalensis TaxID=28829 RepID=A0AAV6SLN7_SOLSE|nr:hypothetical protein JOB18_016147 [Solea senegalensis]